MLVRALHDGVRLAPLEPVDAGALIAHLDESRTHLRAWLPELDSIASFDDAASFLAENARAATAGSGVSCGLWCGARLAGVVGIGAIDRDAGTATIGYWLGRGVRRPRARDRRRSGGHRPCVRRAPPAPGRDHLPGGQSAQPGPARASRLHARGHPQGRALAVRAAHRRGHLRAARPGVDVAGWPGILKSCAEELEDEPVPFPCPRETEPVALATCAWIDTGPGWTTS